MLRQRPLQTTVLQGAKTNVGGTAQLLRKEKLGTPRDLQTKSEEVKATEWIEGMCNFVPQIKMFITSILLTHKIHNKNIKIHTSSKYIIEYNKCSNRVATR